MAKRKTKRIAARAERKRQKEAGIEHPKGQSNYALKKKGERQPGPAQSRPSWFVRFGWAANAERISQTQERLAA